MISKKNSRFLPWALGVAGVLIGGGAIAYFIIAFNSAKGKIPVGANLIPQSALMSVSVSTDTNQWQQFQQLGTADTQKLIADNLTKLKAQLLTNRGLDYTKDIQPWIGKQATVALLPLTPATVTPSKQQPQMWVLPIARPDEAQKAAARFGSGKLASRTYKGVQIQQTSTTEANPYALAVLDQQFVVVTTVPALMDQVIDTYQTQSSAVQIQRYTSAWQQLPTDGAFAQVYVNMPAALKQTSLQPEAASPSPTPIASQPETQGLVTAVSLEPESVRFQSVTWLKPGSGSRAMVDNRAQSVSQRLPQETLAMYSGSNFQKFWQNYSQPVGAQATPAQSAEAENPLSANQIRMTFKSSTGMDFDQDFVTWMDGEFAAAILPAKSNQGAGILIMAQTRDRAKAEKAMAQLDQVVRQRMQWIVSESKVADQTVTQWKVPPGLPAASRGWLDNNTAFLTLGAQVTDKILPQPQKNLEQSALFRAATQSELNDNNGQLFVDMPRALSLLDANPLLFKLTPENRKIAQAIQTLSVTTADNNDWSTQYDVAVKLLKK
jgi:hypothetical protein